jgi:hypothetical protein
MGGPTRRRVGAARQAPGHAVPTPPAPQRSDSRSPRRESRSAPGSSRPAAGPPFQPMPWSCSALSLPPLGPNGTPLFSANPFETREPIGDEQTPGEAVGGRLACSVSFALGRRSFGHMMLAPRPSSPRLPFAAHPDQRAGQRLLRTSQSALPPGNSLAADDGTWDTRTRAGDNIHQPSEVASASPLPVLPARRNGEVTHDRPDRRRGGRLPMCSLQAA